MKPNPLLKAASDNIMESIGDTCRECGSSVTHYTANRTLIDARPEAGDWWVACDNADCVNAYGDESGQAEPDWVVGQTQ